MKKHPVFGVLFAVAVAAVFLAVSYPNKKSSNSLTGPVSSSNYYMYY